MDQVPAICAFLEDLMYIMASPGSGHELYQPHLYEDPGPRSLVIHKIMAQVPGVRNFGKDLVNIMPSPGSGHELYQLHVYEDPRPSFLVIYKYGPGGCNIRFSLTFDVYNAIPGVGSRTVPTPFV